MAQKRFLVGVFGDEDVVKEAAEKVRGEDVNIKEVYCPYPVHGLDAALGYERARMGVPAFFWGLTGTISAFLLTFWTMGIDWPMNVGGKNFFPFPTNIPIVFELTVLFAAFGMTFTFYVSEGLGFFNKPILFDPRQTDDKFAMAIDLGKNQKTEEEITKILKEAGAEEVNYKEVEV